MKKFLSVAFVFVLLLAVSASAEVIQFPSAKITIDVAPGWEYSDNGQGTAIVIAPDKSASISITKLPAAGLTVEKWAEDLSKAHKGTTPEDAGGSMVYQFNDGKTTVMVVLEDDFVGIIAITGEHEDIGDMMGSIEDM